MKYWKWDDYYYVEKSPASMMKLFSMLQLVSPISKKTKFIIVLKVYLYIINYSNYYILLKLNYIKIASSYIEYSYCKIL